MSYDLVTFGEAMIRLSSPNHTRLEQTATLDVCAGGAEWNVACNGARLGLSAAWVSRLERAYTTVGRSSASSRTLASTTASR